MSDNLSRDLPLGDLPDEYKGMSAAELSQAAYEAAVRNDPAARVIASAAADAYQASR